jgi:hypothetical protein
VLLPEYADPQAGRLDLVSVVLSLAAILPGIYAVKHIASHGEGASTAILLVIGAAAGVAFVRRQRALASPLLDVTLFTNRAFSAALAVLLIGLVGVGGTMYLVTQYLQLVEGLTPFIAGLWMGPPALAMFVAAIGAPLVARRVRPGLVMGLTLGLSVIGYALLATAGTGSAVTVVSGFAFVYLGLGAIAALGIGDARLVDRGRRAHGAARQGRKCQRGAAGPAEHPDRLADAVDERRRVLDETLGRVVRVVTAQPADPGRARVRRSQSRRPTPPG